MGKPSAACCSIPPVQTGSYDGRGEYIQVDGTKTYRSGPKAAKRAILVIYDIFGFYPQTIQGADILAYGDSEHSAQVFMPDIFEGEPAKLEWYPPGEDKEKQSKLGEFFSSKADQGKAKARVGELVKVIQKEYGVEKIGVLGYCWGGKVAALSSFEGTPFVAGAMVHPAFVDPEDGSKITIPFAVLPSQDEDKEAVEKLKSGFKVDHVVEYFPTQVHGWMAARSDLGKEEVKKEYERGYKVLLDFFHEHL